MVEFNHDFSGMEENVLCINIFEYMCPDPGAQKQP